jgi:hypothetical protein
MLPYIAYMDPMGIRPYFVVIFTYIGLKQRPEKNGR